MLPKDFDGGERKYLEHLHEELLPVLLEKALIPNKAGTALFY